MLELKQFIIQVFETEEVIKISINGAIYKTNDIKKIIISEKSGKTNFYQIEKFTTTQVFHTNIEDTSVLIDEIYSILENKYKQMDIVTTTNEHKIIMNKKGNFKITSKKSLKDKKVQKHNAEKNHILKEGEIVPFLVELGITDKEGNVYKDKRKKYTQVNRYLEELQIISKHLPDDACIVDFGCGKSYLTFAIYHFFNNMLNKNCRVIGIDIKEDVIKKCDDLKQKMGYDNIEFYNVDAKDFKQQYNVDVDLVVSLHACNLATDYALETAVSWGVKAIMAVPCCHKELYPQVKNDTLNPMLKYGILKEKFQTLLCDTIRGICLEGLGYSVVIKEFVEASNTPKNVLIMAIFEEKTEEKRQKAITEYKAIKDDFNINQTLYNLLYNA